MTDPMMRMDQIYKKIVREEKNIWHNSQMCVVHNHQTVQIIEKFKGWMDNNRNTNDSRDVCVSVILNVNRHNGKGLGAHKMGIDVSREKPKWLVLRLLCNSKYKKENE